MINGKMNNATGGRTGAKKDPSPKQSAYPCIGGVTKSDMHPVFESESPVGIQSDSGPASSLVESEKNVIESQKTALLDNATVTKGAEPQMASDSAGDFFSENQIQSLLSLCTENNSKSSNRDSAGLGKENSSNQTSSPEAFFQAKTNGSSYTEPLRLHVCSSNEPELLNVKMPVLPEVATVYFTHKPPAVGVGSQGMVGGVDDEQKLNKIIPARRQIRTLIVHDNDADTEEHLDFHLRAREKRAARDDMEALKILKHFRNSIVEFDDRERYYKRKHLLAWQAAISMPRTKKTPFETEIPLAATTVLRKRLPKRERVRRRILQAFGCCNKNPRYIDEVLTQLSVDNFNSRYNHMKEEGAVVGFGIKRRVSIFSTTHPKFIEQDQPDWC